MTDFFKKLEALFGDFDRQARVYPVLIAALPVLVQIAVIWPKSPLVALAPLVLGVGLLSLLADAVRVRGQSLEPQLIERWNGLPTRHLLRLADEDSNKYLVEQRRDLIETMSGMKLATRQQERRNARDAADRIDAAVRKVIPRVKGKDNDEILHRENIAYNFRRNLLAIRPASAGLALACLVLDAVLYARNYERELVLTAGGVALAMLIMQLLLVNETFVRRAADSYARRFFEALQIKQQSGGGSNL